MLHGSCSDIGGGSWLVAENSQLGRKIFPTLEHSGKLKGPEERT